LDLLEKENKKRELSSDDHRVLGQQLDMYSINEEVGIGLVLWHPKGTVVRKIIRDFWEEEHVKNEYQLVCTPHIARGELWRISGHLDYYSRNMYVFEKDEEAYVVKPMNCPFHIHIYKSRPRSYKDHEEGAASVGESGGNNPCHRPGCRVGTLLLTCGKAGCLKCRGRGLSVLSF